MEPSEMSDEEWSQAVAYLERIRKMEKKTSPF